MTANQLKGKTIKKVHQSGYGYNSGYAWTIDAIEFTDGSFLRLTVLESENGDYGVEGVYPARPARRLTGSD